MGRSNPDIATFQNVALQNSALGWYAIADSAQHSSLPGAVVQEGLSVQCLFGAPQACPLAHHAPHLVELCPPTENWPTWNWISRHANSKPCVTIIATRMSFEELFVQLAGCIEVVLPDRFEMFLGFWDPAILGALMGQGDDRTLHIAGPVLSSSQKSKLTRGMDSWWYWDRDGAIHSIPIEPLNAASSTAAINLIQAQVDDLVEACLPDHVLYYVELNQPLLIAEIPVRKRYGVVREALVQAREVGLLGMKDLVNFVCVKLIYGERMRTDGEVLGILEKVREGSLTFPEALIAFP